MPPDTKQRRICQGCHYPDVVCLCPAITKVHSPVSIIVLQHPNESGHAKNTARLIELCMDNAQIVKGIDETDFFEIKQRCETAPEDFWLLYPSEQSSPIEQYNQNSPSLLPKTLILIDATWPKAYKIWRLNPWLQGLRCVHFDNAPPSNYRIRKVNNSAALSTLEATAYALQTGFSVDVTPLRTIQTELQRQWLRFSQQGQSVTKSGGNE